MYANTTNKHDEYGKIEGKWLPTTALLVALGVYKSEVVHTAVTMLSLGTHRGISCSLSPRTVIEWR